MKRLGNRKLNQMRNVSFKKNVNRYAEGSVLITQGNTKVLCLATIEEEVPRFLRDTGSGWVTAEYSMIPRSTHTRMDRESRKGKISGRTQEISRLVGRALRSIVDFKLLGERQIIVDCEVLQADGGTRCASITGGFVALKLAINKLLKDGTLSKDPIIDHVAAISTGIIQSKACLDLNYEEDSTAEVDMNFIMTGKGKFVEVQGTAEGHPFSFEDLTDMKNLAAKGIRELVSLQKKII